MRKNKLLKMKKTFTYTLSCDDNGTVHINTKNLISDMRRPLTCEVVHYEERDVGYEECCPEDSCQFNDVILKDYFSNFDVEVDENGIPCFYYHFDLKTTCSGPEEFNVKIEYDDDYDGQHRMVIDEMVEELRMKEEDRKKGLA